VPLPIAKITYSRSQTNGSTSMESWLNYTNKEKQRYTNKILFHSHFSFHIPHVLTCLLLNQEFFKERLAIKVLNYDMHPTFALQLNLTVKYEKNVSRSGGNFNSYNLK
jgi:hypothetical protein